MDNRILNIAILGTGSRGRFLAESILKDNRFKLNALIDRDDNNLQGALKYLKQDIKTFTDLKDAVAAIPLDAVCITTPDNTHADLACQAFKLGLNVLCEKPLEISLDGCDRILQAQRQSGKVLLVGFVLRYVRKLRKMKELIAQGRIGTPVMAYANHEVPQGSRWYFHDWHALRKNSTGLLLQKGSHDLDIINWFMDAKPVRVMASGGRNFFGGTEDNALTCQTCPKARTCPDHTTHIDFFPDMTKPISCAYRREIDVEDNHLVIVDYGNGTRASYSECHFSPYERRTFCVIGTQGRIEAGDGDSLRLTTRFPVDSITFDLAPVAGGHGGGDTLILDDLYDAIVNHKPVLADGMAGRTSVQIAIAAHQSMREHRIITL